MGSESAGQRERPERGPGVQDALVERHLPVVERGEQQRVHPVAVRGPAELVEQSDVGVVRAVGSPERMVTTSFSAGSRMPAIRLSRCS